MNKLLMIAIAFFIIIIIIGIILIKEIKNFIDEDFNEENL